MNRNQKIALGCGGAGCLGLIVVGIAGVLIYFLAYRATSDTNRNYNYSTNRNSNSNEDSDITANTNDNSNSSSSTSVTSMSEDDKHKLYHAAYVTGDAELLRRVSVKIGLMNDDFTISDKYGEFLVSHASWTVSNTDFIETISTAEKARTYVNQNFPD